MSYSKRANALYCITESDKSSPSKCEEHASPVLSPITGIAQQLMKSVLSPHDNRIGYSQDFNGSSSTASTSQGLFKNAFTIKSTPENLEKSKPTARRLLGITPRDFYGPESPSDDKENDGGFFSPYTTSPLKVSRQTGCTKKTRNPLEECNPNSRENAFDARCSEKAEKSIRDRFQFAEPRALAPRRSVVDIHSPMQSPMRPSTGGLSPETMSPMRASPVGLMPIAITPMRPSPVGLMPAGPSPGGSPLLARVARHSLLRSISSGYESMEDGLNDLTDSEKKTGNRLPNGISTLLSGDIVIGETLPGSSNPRTPEFARINCDSGNVKRSTSSQKQKERSSNISRVRSCLFRSPTTSSSTKSPTFEDNMLATRICNGSRRRGRRLAVTFSSPDLSPVVSRKSSLPARCAFKRPESTIPDGNMHLAKKFRKTGSFLEVCEAVTMTTVPVPKIHRSLSESATTKMEVDVESETDSEVQSELETHTLIKSAILRSTTSADLTGDFSKPCVLPLAEGHHDDLRSISTQTLAALIRGDFDDQINSFKIVDCRYPYEFDAGHIQGALNLYSKDLIEQILLNPLTNRPEIQPDTNKRNILVFHCEFSWERGPNLSRFLRSLDRQRNKEHYPALHYPEVYLLHGGYEQFYKEQRELCSPQGYRPMKDPAHEEDLRQFRSKSKSWQGEKSRINGNVSRPSLKRLGF